MPYQRLRAALGQMFFPDWKYANGDALRKAALDHYQIDKHNETDILRQYLNVSG